MAWHTGGTVRDNSPGPDALSVPGESIRSSPAFHRQAVPKCRAGSSYALRSAATATTTPTATTTRLHDDVDPDVVRITLASIRCVLTCERDRDRGCARELDPIGSRRLDAQVVAVHYLTGCVDLGRRVRTRWNCVSAGGFVLDAERDALVMHQPLRRPRKQLGCRSNH
jgi:hypothetical protein